MKSKTLKDIGIKLDNYSEELDDFKIKIVKELKREAIKEVKILRKLQDFDYDRSPTDEEVDEFEELMEEYEKFGSTIYIRSFGNSTDFEGTINYIIWKNNLTEDDLK